jgi:hypothetical protein
MSIGMSFKPVVSNGLIPRSFRRSLGASGSPFQDKFCAPHPRQQRRYSPVPGAGSIPISDSSRRSPGTIGRRARQRRIYSSLLSSDAMTLLHHAQRFLGGSAGAGNANTAYPTEYSQSAPRDQRSYAGVVLDHNGVAGPRPGEPGGPGLTCGTVTDLLYCGPCAWWPPRPGPAARRRGSRPACRCRGRARGRTPGRSSAGPGSRPR